MPSLWKYFCWPFILLDCSLQGNERKGESQSEGESPIEEELPIQDELVKKIASNITLTEYFKFFPSLNSCCLNASANRLSLDEPYSFFRLAFVFLCDCFGNHLHGNKCNLETPKLGFFASETNCFAAGFQLWWRFCLLAIGTFLASLLTWSCSSFLWMLQKTLVKAKLIFTVGYRFLGSYH